MEGIVTVIFVGVDNCCWQGELMNMPTQGLTLSIEDDTQPDLTAQASNRSQHGWTVIAKCPPSPAFVSPAAGRVIKVEMLNAFFPPHPEIVQHFQLQYPPQGYYAVSVQH